MSGCRHVVAMLDAYADGELAPDQVLEIETHLVDCHGCSARLQLDHAVRKSLRRTTYAAAAPSDAFRERIMASLQAEQEREQALERSELAGRGAVLSWGNILPLAAAAAIALFWSANANQQQRQSKIIQQGSAAPMSVEQLLEDIVDRHIDRSTPAVTEPALLDGLEPQVGVPVRMPSLAQYGARWEGGGVQLTNQRVASLRFRLDGHRMTLYVFNVERFVPLDSRLKKRVVRDEPVYVGWKRGYSIAAADRHGVGYAVASDLGEDEGAEIVASLH